MTERLIGLDKAIELPGLGLGLLSDSHGDAAMTRAALTQLLSRDADAIVHLGDLCADAVLEELVGLRTASGKDVAAFAVPGNMDDDPEELVRHGGCIDVVVGHPALSFSFGEMRLIAHHGHIARVERAAANADVDVVLHGHSHKVRDENVGRTRFINPGALHRASRYTAAMLNLENGHLDVFEIAARE